MRIGIVVFPGSNCDEDCARAVRSIAKTEPVMLWHKDATLKNCEAVILPGGFSYGDYLRCGAIARHSPVMSRVIEAADKGMPVLGICNGFQILTEAGLLPGVLMRNCGLKFICRDVRIRLENSNTPFTRRGQAGKTYRIPIAHMEGNYFIDADGLAELQRHEQIVFRYVDTHGETTDTANPNGALANIAGVCNAQKNVVGLMPHPERACEEILGGTDGQFFFAGLSG